MELFLNIFILVLAVLVLFLGILIFTPIRYTIQGGYRERPYLNILVKNNFLFKLKACFDPSPFFSLIILGLPFKIRPGKAGGQRKKKEKEKSSKESKGSGINVWIFTDKDFLNSTLVFLSNILKILSPEHLEIRGKMGFDDPYYNGCLAAFNWFCQTSLPFQRINVDLEPVWGEEYKEVAVVACGKMAVYLILYRTIKYLLSKEFRNIWREIRAINKKRKIKKEAVLSG